MKNILALFLFFSVLQGFSQRFSTNPDEFIGQLDKSLREARQEKFAEQFRSTWMRGTFTAAQQEKIIALTQKIISKKGAVGREVKRFLEALENALETQSLSSTQLDNLLVVSEQFFVTANAGQILTFAERLNSLFLYKALYLSNYNKIYVDGSYEIIFSDSLTRSKHSWFKGWKEGESEPDSLGNVQPYPHPLIAGASIVFPKTNLYLVTPEDSVSINDTKIVLVLEKDYLVGDKGRFSWQSLYNRGEIDSVALGGGISRKDIYVDLERYSHRLSNQIFKAGQATLAYPSKIKDPVKGVFEFASEKRKNIKDLKYPLFKSYEEKSEVFNIGKDISYTGGIKVQGFKLYGYSPTQRPNGRLFVKKGSEVKFHANSKEFYLGEDKIYAKSASFGYYISGADSLTHIDVTLSYNRTQIQGDSTPANIFKLYKDKKNDDIPFIDEYHKMYITADLALYHPEKDLVDFYILGASEKVPAIFESFSYFDEERYNEIQGGYDFQPLQLVQFYADKYGYTNSQGDKEFNLFAVLEEVEEENKKIKRKNRNQPVATAGAVKSAVNRLAREGYVNFDPYDGKVVILNRTTQNVNSYFYKKAMDFVEKNPKKKIPPTLAPYAEKDFDDMLIESISPRDARKDSVLKDTIRFSFNGGRILYPKLENKNIFITKRVFVSKPDTTASVGLDGEEIKARRDTTITLTDTFKIDRFLTSQKVLLTQDLELLRLDPNQFTLMELEGYFSTGSRKKGPAMPNASLIEGGGIIIRGIERFAISKKLNLNFIPKNKEIRIFGDRVINMEEGEVTVGNFRFIGKNFVLPYDEFKLTMGEIDTVLFAVQDPKNPNLKYELGGEIKMNAGDLLINHPNNKSGLKRGQIPGWKKGEVYEAYPKLSIEAGGKIYFDAFYRERFAYHKSQVYFEIPKIELDSLNSKMPKFSGTFYSNIFPPIKEELVAIYDPKYNGVESKYALGFVHRPKKPLKLYHTKAELKADSIVMYKTGLVASGKNLEIKNHTYTLKTSELVLTPDSVHTKNANILVKQGKIGNAFYPEALGENLKLSWYTTKMAGKDTLKLDSLTLRNKPKDYIRLFDTKNPASLSGTMAITPEALWAIGKITRKDFFLFAPQGATISPDRIFTPDLPDNIVEFKVHSTDLDPFNVEYGTDYKHLIDANAVFVDFDLKNAICKISHNPFISKQNAQYEFFSFPYAQFKTSIKEATWDVKKKEITMKGDDNSIFHSTKFEEEEQAPNKDLYFKATAGKYDIKDLNTPILELEGVPHITSADARIIPDKGKVTILKGADVQTLQNSTVVVDTLNSYHTLVNGNIKINNREDFEGDATYRYVNVVKDTAKIKFDRFELVGSEAVSEAGKVKRTSRFRKKGKNEDTLQIPSRYTQSRGEVLETDNFFITSRIKFKGTAEMLAYKKDLILDGFIKLVLKSRKDGDFWIPYQRDAGDVLIEVEEKMEAQGDVVTSGLHYTYEENGKLYTTFLSGKKGDEDTDMHLAKGVLTYSPELNEFKITDKAKLEKDSYEGSLLILDDGKGTMEMQGKFNFFDENTKKLISAAGTTKVDLKKNHYEFNQLFAIDFSKFKSVLSGIADMFKFAKMDGGGEQAYNTDDASLMNRLAEIIGDSKAKKYENQARGKYIPLVNADKKVLGKGLVISSVNLVWSDTTNSFYSVGKIGLANILDKDVNAQIDGFMEIQKQEDGDVLNLYLEASPELWIFLSFSQNTLSGESSIEKVNNQFSKGKKAKKVGDLSMELAEDGAAEHFKARFKQFYTDKNFGEVKRVAKKVEEKEEPEEEPEKKPKKSKKKKKKTDEDEEEEEPAEEKKEEKKKEEPKKEEPKKEEKPKEEKKSKKKKKTDEDEEEEEPAEEKRKEEPKKEEPKKEEKSKEEKKKEEKKPKTEKPEKPKKEKKKKKGEDEEEEEPEEEMPKKKDKKKEDDKDGF
jgi:hypothetical protein